MVNIHNKHYDAIDCVDFFDKIFGFFKQFNFFKYSRLIRRLILLCNPGNSTRLNTPKSSVLF